MRNHSIHLHQQMSISPPFQKLAKDLVGELIRTDVPGEVTMYLSVYEQREHITLLELELTRNRLANEKAAFTVLHVLSHLNGAAFGATHGMAHLNPAVIRALTKYHRATGAGYRLHYRPERE